jgi:hypothetical protein
MLAADNTARLCSKCHRDQRDSLHAPPAHLRDEFCRMMSAAADSSALQHFDQLLAASPSQSLLP